MSVKSQRMVRQAVGAGRWFPGSKAALQKMVDEFMDRAAVSNIPGRIVGAIAPHAGYVYSGPTAGYVFRALRDQAKQGTAPDVLVILGFTHSRGFPGVALMGGDAIATPLGEAALDKEAAAVMLKNRSSIRFDNAPHNGEHSAENQIPFAQAALPAVPLVVGLIGDHNSRILQDLVAALNELARVKKIVVIASSDMLHDPDYDLVSKTDRETLKLVAAMKTSEVLARWTPEHQIFCGITSVTVVMQFAAGQGCREATILHYRNNGDDFPESRGEWVVGYGAVIFTVAKPGAE